LLAPLVVVIRTGAEDCTLRFLLQLSFGVGECPVARSGGDLQYTLFKLELPDLLGGCGNRCICLCRGHAQRRLKAFGNPELEELKTQGVVDEGSQLPGLVFRFLLHRVLAVAEAGLAVLEEVLRAEARKTPVYGFVLRAVRRLVQHQFHGGPETGSCADVVGGVDRIDALSECGASSISKAWWSPGLVRDSKVVLPEVSVQGGDEIVLVISDGSAGGIFGRKESRGNQVGWKGTGGKDSACNIGGFVLEPVSNISKQASRHEAGRAGGKVI